MTTRLSSLSSVVADHVIGLAETIDFLSAHAPDGVRERLTRSLEAAGNRRRHAVLPLRELARLGGASERGRLYREHATSLGERAVASLADVGALDPGRVTTVVFVSSTGWAAPSIDSHLVRRFGLSTHCRRIPLTQLGCGGGVAALSLAAEMVARDPAQRVLVVSAEVPSLHLQLAEPSYWELLTSAQFADGAAAAVVSAEDGGPEILATRSILLPEIEEGGRILPGESGFRLIGSTALPSLIRARVRDLVGGFLATHDPEAGMPSFVAAHPRGVGVLDAVAEGLALDRSALAASYAAWEGTGNMVSASVYRVLAELSRHESPRRGDRGMLLAFGTGVACELALMRWTSAPVVACERAE